MSHGCPDINSTYHQGDFGNVNAVFQDTVYTGIYLRTGVNLTFSPGVPGNINVIGKAFVLHQKQDSCSGDTGNAGDRMAQCVIGIDNVPGNMAAWGGGDSNMYNGSCFLLPTANGESTLRGSILFTQSLSTVLNASIQVYGLQQRSSNQYTLKIFQHGDLRSLSGTPLYQFDPLFVDSGSISGTQAILTSIVGINTQPNIFGHAISLESSGIPIAGCVIGSMINANHVVPTASAPVQVTWTATTAVSTAVSTAVATSAISEKSTSMQPASGQGGWIAAVVIVILVVVVVAVILVFFIRRRRMRARRYNHMEL